MEIVNCYWEKDNLNKDVVEITFSLSDNFNVDEIISLESQYDYIVIKVPMNMVNVNFQLSKIGYILVENQI